MSNTVKIGIFVSAALVLLAYFILKIEDVRLFTGDAARVEAAFDSVAGLDDKAAVRIAGVRVGRVDGIRLVNDRALVGLLFERRVELREGAHATVATQGLLGDRHISLYPGPADAPPLSEGAVLPGTTPVSLDQAIERFNQIGVAVDETLTAMDPTRSGEAIREALASLRETTATIRDIVRTNQSQVGDTIQNFERVSAVLAAELPRISRQTGEVIAAVERILAENRGDVRRSMEQLADASETLKSSLVHFETISGRLAGGEGSVGKLLTEDTAHDQLVSTLASVESGVASLSDTLNRVRRLQLELGFEGYYLEASEEPHSAFRLRFDPGGDSNRFYQVGLVDDPRGRVRSKTVQETLTRPDGTREVTTVETLSVEDKQTLSAQVGFVNGATSFRAGLFESTGGAAIDYSVFDRKLRLTLEAFDFGREDDLNPRLRLSTRWSFHKHAYLVGGVDDLIESRRQSIFLGAGFHWTDDELKYLLGAVPVP